MERKYTEDVYEEFVNTIKEVDETELSRIIDFLGDVMATFGSWIGLLKIDYYLDNLSVYHRAVLDQHNTTVQELDQIFDDVDAVDFNYRDHFSSICESAKGFRAYLDALCGLVKPGAEFTAETINGASGNLQAILNQSKSTIESVYASQINRAALEELEKSSKELFGDIINIPKKIFSLTKDFATGNGAAILSDLWDIVNIVPSTAYDIGAILALAMGFGISTVTGRKSVMDKAIDYAKEGRETNGIKDWASQLAENSGEKQENDYFDYGNLWGTVSTGAEYADIANDIYGIAKDGKEMADISKSIIGDKNISGGEKARRLLEYFVLGDDSDYKKKPNLPDGVQKVISDNKRSSINELSKYWGYIKTADKALENGDTSGVVIVKEMFGQNDLAKFDKDIVDLITDDLAIALDRGEIQNPKVTYNPNTGEWEESSGSMPGADELPIIPRLKDEIRNSWNKPIITKDGKEVYIMAH